MNVKEIKKEEKTSEGIKKYIEMIQKSWTFNNMTATEQAHCIEALTHTRTRAALKGTDSARWEILQAIYFSFLAALGYTENPGNWREKEQQPF